jgi:hypothetical protein
MLKITTLYIYNKVGRLRFVSEKRTKKVKVLLGSNYKSLAENKFPHIGLFHLFSIVQNVHLSGGLPISIKVHYSKFTHTTASVFVSMRGVMWLAALGLITSASATDILASSGFQNCGNGTQDVSVSQFQLSFDRSTNELVFAVAGTSRVSEKVTGT